MKKSILTTAMAMASMSDDRLPTNYGYKKNGRVRTDLGYIREIGMPNTPRSWFRKNNKARG